MFFAYTNRRNQVYVEAQTVRFFSPLAREKKKNSNNNKQIVLWERYIHSLLIYSGCSTRDISSFGTMRCSRLLCTATPERFTILGTTFPKPKRNGMGRENKMRSKPSDNVAWYDKGPVEWLPRPVRLNYDQLDQLRDWMMRETIAGRTEEFNKIRHLHREWSQHPLMPMLGDVEPKFPLNLYKQNHRAKHRFLVRWHKANSPTYWMWMPRGPAVATPLHRSSPSQFPEQWRQLARNANGTVAK